MYPSDNTGSNGSASTLGKWVGVLGKLYLTVVARERDSAGFPVASSLRQMSGSDAPYQTLAAYKDAGASPEA
jgi:hypothetical protein